MPVTRRVALMLPLMSVACSDDPPRIYPPIRYDYLPPLRLNVGSLDFAPLPLPGQLDQVAPVAPGPALQQMAQDRLAASGSSGRALITIEEARISRGDGGLDGSLALHLDVMAADGRRVGYAEARVVRRVNRPGSDFRTTLYDMTKQMLDDMNVELEFQLRRSLRDYIQATTNAPAPAAVLQQDLGAPRRP